MTADSSQHSRAQKTWEEHSLCYDEIKAQYHHTQPDQAHGFLGVDTEEQSVHEPFLRKLPDSEIQPSKN